MLRSPTASVSDSKICVRVVEAVAASEGVAPDELGYQLYDYIDPDVLRRLDHGADSDWSLQFTVAHHTVSVESTGEIAVDDVEYHV